MTTTIAHMFPSMPALRRHLNDVLCEDVAHSVDMAHRVYYGSPDVMHRCFVICDREDVNALLGYTFHSHVIHGDFDRLTPDDYKHMTDFIAQRTRGVPEDS